jgi:alpha-beta hydrolase superfamily lysophospholipase
LFYFNQEKLGFHPTKLAANYKYDFKGNFEEINLKTEDGVTIHNLLFKAENSKGVVFYLHGNSGSLKRVEKRAAFYTSLGYDYFRADYRGYNKSEGAIHSESQLHQDNQMLYDYVKKRYLETTITVIGHSLGGALAAKLAAANNPKHLVLTAPFCGGEKYKKRPKKEGDASLISKVFKVLPMKLLLKYTLKTNEFLLNCKMPVLIFHGNADRGIVSSIKLKEDFKPEDRLVILEGQGHSGIIDNVIYQKEMKKLLEK